MRGVIVSKLINITRFGFSIQSELDPQNLRMWLLHWDKLDYPISGSIGENTPEEQFLMDAGVMQRTLADPQYEQSDSAAPENGGLFNSVLDTFRLLEADAPGAWSIARTKLPETPWDEIEPKRNFESDETGRGLYIRLMSSIPVPAQDVPLHDILEFKDKRMSEMLKFRAHIDEIYNKVLAAPDRPLAELREIESLQHSVKDILDSGPSLSWKLFDLNGKFNLASSATAVVTAQSLGLDPVSTILAGFGSAAIHIGPSFSFKGDPAKGTPFEYVARYHRDL
ncbi:hypothetical protein ACSSV1_003080 [Labrenzia sp. MBR-25]